MRQQLPADVQAPALARQAVRRELCDSLGTEELADIQLMVSELVTNSILHSAPRAGDVTLEVDANDPIRIMVSDRGEDFSLDHDGWTGGWGLALVERLSDRWGLARGNGTRVWFEMDRN